MSDLIPAVMNWSGGKDCALALHYVVEQHKINIRYLLTTVNDSFSRVAMHGIREELLLNQVNQLGIKLLRVGLPEMPDMPIYERIMSEQFTKLKIEGVSHSIYGDIFLEDLRMYREAQLAKHKMTAIFPLWKKDTTELVNEFIDLGYQTIVVCAKEGLQDFCGQVIDKHFLKELPKGIDPCGENGEFHTFVFDGPLFNGPVNFVLGEKEYRSFPSPNSATKKDGFWYIDLLPTSN